MKWAAAILRRCSVARIRGLEMFFDFRPGAYAPGFMLAPAPQAKPDFTRGSD